MAKADNVFIEAQEQIVPVVQAVAQIATKGLVSKLAEIMAEVSRVPKSGRNEHYNYSYATEADIAEAVRAGLSKRSIMMFPRVTQCDFSDRGKMRFCSMTVEFTLEDGESGDTRKIVVVGEGSDTGDKSPYKAMTGAEKYALMKLFLIPTGDDPERDDHRPTPEVESHGQTVPAAVQESFPGANIEPPLPPMKPRPVPQKRAGAPVVPFGEKKGQPLSDLDSKELQYLIKYSTKSIQDPGKSKYKPNNIALLSALQQELKSRTISKENPNDDIPF